MDLESELIRKDFDEDLDCFKLLQGPRTARAFGQDEASSFEDQVRLTFGLKKTKSQDGGEAGDENFLRTSASFPGIEVDLHYQGYMDSELHENRSLRLKGQQF